MYWRFAQPFFAKVQRGGKSGQAVSVACGGGDRGGKGKRVLRESLFEDVQVFLELLLRLRLGARGKRPASDTASWD